MNDSTILELNAVSKSYGELRAVDQLTLSVKSGECFSLLGPNGAGKTTSIEMMEGLTLPDDGEIRVFGMTYAQSRRQILSRLGVVLQETNLYKRFTVKETWELFGSFYEDVVLPEQLAKRLSLEDKLHSQLHELSGGQRQRTYLGCALVNRPRILFLDEPTTGLDPTARRQVWELLRQLKEEGTTLVLTTHYMEEAELLADRVGVMNAGRLIALDTPEQLIKETCGTSILEIRTKGEKSLDAEMSIEGFPRPLRALTKSRDLEEYAFNEEASAFDAAQSVAKFCQQNVVGLRSAAVRRASLEDVFISLAGRSLSDV